MIKPDEVTPENVAEARDQILSEMKSILTTARRNEEMATALANRSDDPNLQKVAQTIRARVSDLEKILDALLKDSET